MEYRKIKEIATRLLEENTNEYFGCLGKFRDAKLDENEILSNSILKELDRISGEGDGIIKLFEELECLAEQSGEDTNI